MRVFFKLQDSAFGLLSVIVSSVFNKRGYIPVERCFLLMCQRN